MSIAARCVISPSVLLLLLLPGPTLADELDMRPIQPYLQEIDRVQQDEGTYSPQLGQLLSQLGVAYQQQNQHQLAIDSFSRALQITKISQGIYALAQVPIIEKMHSSMMAQNRWKELDDLHQRVYWLVNRNYQPDDPHLLPYLFNYASWLLFVHHHEFLNETYVRLLQSEALYQQTHDIILANYGDKDPRMVQSLKGLVMANFFKSQLGPAQLEFNFDSLDMTRQGSFYMGLPAVDYRTENYREGKLALEKMVEIYDAQTESAAMQNKVLARVGLADWYLMFGKTTHAFDTYREARELARQGQENNAFQLFERPTLLPDSKIFLGEDGQYREPDRFVLASFDVNAHGKANNIQLLDSIPLDATAMRSRALKFLRTASFRPRFEEEEPIETLGVRLKLSNP
ncbi:tetratricopeptide repeat protein [Bowmanella sp. Y26]|uniref:tetratricopeptide repeat protein n=1 Tax=Bowmanella yangjiangensis TaxID=2811230 RepID=UPI001BDCCD32|nr:tetratricopeptide repeat protein [Bowmanella yangjiangensis]MBT1063107.1 tetratricopeptide repeat protein [Bowmanella yangjiangensis]